MGGADGGATQRALEGDVIVTAMNPRALMKKNSAFPLLANRAARRRGAPTVRADDQGMSLLLRTSGERLDRCKADLRIARGMHSVGGALRADDAWPEERSTLRPVARPTPRQAGTPVGRGGGRGSASRRLLFICAGCRGQAEP